MKYKSALYCGHANEYPNAGCGCSLDCHCRIGMCKLSDATLAELQKLEITRFFASPGSRIVVATPQQDAEERQWRKTWGVK